MPAGAGADCAYVRCAELIAQADGLLITAGAGMGVDSGLPDFRGEQGFWRAYPALGRARLAFEEIANPSAFGAQPRLAWGFYGHRLQLYRHTVPHEGFAILRRIGKRMTQGAFVFTSNVDGQFQKAGFDESIVCECHGSIHHLQCVHGCRDAIWPATSLQPEVDAGNCLLASPLPHCPCCGALARPNVLMFGDWGWLGARTACQQQRLRDWLRSVERLLVIEIGAGTNIPTVRLTGERLAGQLIRINPDEAEVGAGRGVAIARSACEALAGIEACLG